MSRAALLAVALLLPAPALAQGEFAAADRVVGTFVDDAAGKVTIRSGEDGWYRLEGALGGHQLEARGLHRDDGWLFVVEREVVPASESVGAAGIVAGERPIESAADASDAGPWTGTLTRTKWARERPQWYSWPIQRIAEGTDVIVLQRKGGYVELLSPEGRRWVSRGGVEVGAPLAALTFRQVDERRFTVERDGATTSLERSWSFAPEAIARAKDYWVANAAATPHDDCITTVNAAVRRLYADPALPVSDQIDRTMNLLVDSGRSLAPREIEFLDADGEKTIGVAAPETLSRSAWESLLDLAGREPGWFVFGLSVMDGYHSVSLVLDNRNPDAPRGYWCDQWKSQGGWLEVTGADLDAKIERHTRSWWNADKPTRTRATLWRLLPAAPADLLLQPEDLETPEPEPEYDEPAPEYELADAPLGS